MGDRRLNSITVNELLAKLLAFPPNAEVIISCTDMDKGVIYDVDYDILKNQVIIYCE
jgi:hypothetical protein